MSALPMPARDYFARRVELSLLGPGSDTFAGPVATEVLDDYPLQRYYTGVLFPERQENRPAGRPAPAAGQREEFFQATDDREQAADRDASGAPEATRPGTEVERDEYAAANQYFPTNAGLTVCLAPGTTHLRVTLRGACYRLAPADAPRVHITADDYALLQRHLPTELAAKLHYDEAEGTLYFTRRPTGTSGRGRSGDYAALSRLLQLDELKTSVAAAQLEKLMAPENRLWQRQPFAAHHDLALPTHHLAPEQAGKVEVPPLALPNGEQARCYVRVLDNDYGRYAKILLHNPVRHPTNRFSNASEDFNAKCLFQVEVLVEAGRQLRPYRNPLRVTGLDPEADQLDYQYRHHHAYGLGHGCAVRWDAPAGQVSTTFVPQVEVPGVSNGLRLDLPAAARPVLEQVLSLKALSIWGEADDCSTEQLLAGLRLFVMQYEGFCEQQRAEAELNPADADCYTPLLQAQEAARDRLAAGVQLLATDPVLLHAFRLANTAMLLQMVLSTDPAYGKREKDYADFEQLFSGTDYQSLEAFRYHPGRPDAEVPGGFAPFRYRPFQLAFLLLSLDSVTRAATPARELVDLIWFPTGGGKTEAYLAVTALAIVWRRLHYPKAEAEGVTVLMRYTLRLLTAQQFERATRLICALEFLRQQLPGSSKRPLLGPERITIGMWVGQATTPNDLAEAREVYLAMQQAIDRLNAGKEADPQAKNRFQLAACPWCGCRTVSKVREYASAFNQQGEATCLNRRCAFGRDGEGPLPVSVVDEMLYRQPPTLLFATVDKFAMLPHKEQGYRFFKPTAAARPPELIIQDELHLLNGPLGSVTGLFERVVNLLCTAPAAGGQPARPPKIIASTATTRNTPAQVRGLYQREVAVFPPAGISYDDSYFTFQTGKSQRRHLGLMPTGKTGLDTQLHLTALLLFARSELLRDLRRTLPAAEQAEVLRRLDDYWTLVLYYNSLRDVGKMYNKVGAEVFTQLRLLHQRFGLATPAAEWSYLGLAGRTRELTSRVESSKIKDALNELGRRLRLHPDEQGRPRVDEGIDLVLASNMLSVGIDIGRLNVMLMSGQPRNSAEYIQASSRVGREVPGLVLVLLDANRAREKSVFEQFTSFNQSYYKYVEPLSLTPFTEVTIDRILNSLLVTYVRHYLRREAHQFGEADANGLLALLDAQMTEPELREYLRERLRQLAADWTRKVANARPGQLHYSKRANGQHLIGQGEEWELMMSMREIDTSTAIAVEPILA